MTVFLDSEEERGPSLSVCQSGPFPVILSVTFTKQLTKKNKIFQDGRLIIESRNVFRLFDPYNLLISTCDLSRADPGKIALFENQYRQAVIAGEGYLQGIFDGVLLFLESPPLLPGMHDFQEVHVLKRIKHNVPDRFESPNFVPIPFTRRSVFKPLQSLGENISLYFPQEEQQEQQQQDSVWLPILNSMLSELFQRSLSSNKSLLGDSQWTITKHSSPEKYYISNRCKNYTAFLPDIISLVIEGSNDSLLLFQPVWKTFNPNGLLLVRPVSQEAIECSIGAVPIPIAAALGIFDLHGSIDFIFALRETSLDDSTLLPLTKMLADFADLENQCPNNVLPRTSLVEEIATRLSLSIEQKSVLESVAAGSPLCIAVHGVFGCGKSTLLAACIYLCAKMAESLPIDNARILVMAATNVAVDNVMLKLKSVFDFSDFARVGVPDKVSSLLIGNTFKTSSSGWMKKRVIGVTAASSCELTGVSCPFVFIDEAAQLTEISAILPLFNVRPARLFLFGDTRQLVQTGTDTLPSILSAFTDRPNTKVLHLYTQYRCHPEIAKLCSDLFYEGKVRSDVVAVPCGLPPVGLVMHQYKANKGSVRSLENHMEIELMLGFLKRPDLVGKSVAVITFYVSQATLVKDQLELRHHMVPVHTVDSFQGSEADIVLVSLTAHDVLKSRSFLGSPNRMNVALSRAKQSVILFGNQRLFQGIGILKEIADRFPNNLL